MQIIRQGVRDNFVVSLEEAVRGSLTPAGSIPYDDLQDRLNRQEDMLVSLISALADSNKLSKDDTQRLLRYPYSVTA